MSVALLFIYYPGVPQRFVVVYSNGRLVRFLAGSCASLLHTAPRLPRIIHQSSWFCNNTQCPLDKHLYSRCCTLTPWCSRTTPPFPLSLNDLVIKVGSNEWGPAGFVSPTCSLTPQVMLMKHNITSALIHFRIQHLGQSELPRTHGKLRS